MKKYPLTRKVLYSTLAMMALTFSLPTVAYSQASITTNNVVIQIDQAAFVPCANGGAGKVVLLSGNLHVLAHVTINQNRLILMTHFQPQGVRGVGQITDDIYHGTGVTQTIGTVPLFGADTITLNNNFRLIAPNTGNNFRVHQIIHTTINANGEFTATVDNASVDCN